MEGNATVDEKPVTLSFVPKDTRADGRSPPSMAPPPEMEMRAHSDRLNGGYGTQVHFVMPPWPSGPPGYQGGNIGQIYPSNQPSMTSHPLRTANDPDIVKWFSYLDRHEDRNKDGITFAPFGPILKQKQFFRLSQLMSSHIKLEALESWLGIEVGAAILILEYAKEDLEAVRAGQLFI